MFTYDFTTEVETIHTMNVRIEDGRVLEVSDDGHIKVYKDNKYVGELHADLAIDFMNGC